MDFSTVTSGLPVSEYSVEEGYFLHYNENNFVFCSTKQLDTQTNKELLNLLQSIPDVKWEEAKHWTLI